MLIYRLTFVQSLLQRYLLRGRHDFLISEQLDPESSSTLKRRLLLMATIVPPVQMVTGVLWRFGTPTILGPR
jgi:hypothetical protein